MGENRKLESKPSSLVKGRGVVDEALGGGDIGKGLKN